LPLQGDRPPATYVLTASAAIAIATTIALATTTLALFTAVAITAVAVAPPTLALVATPTLTATPHAPSSLAFVATVASVAAAPLTVRRHIGQLQAAVLLCTTGARVSATVAAVALATDTRATLPSG